MLFNCLWLFAFGALLVSVQSLPTGLGDDAKKSEQSTKPKVKRSQEVLMFGNQQNRQATENKAANSFSPSAEKRTLSNSGLDDVSSPLNDSDQQSANHPKALPSGYMIDQPSMTQHEKNYEYGKVLVNEIGDILPRGAWEMSPYNRYYGAGGEDRRKRSEDSNSPASSTSNGNSNSNSGSVGNGISGSISPAAVAAQSASAPVSSQSSIPQPKRSIPSYYQEPRYKRELDLDPEDFLALLSLYDSEHRNRGNWRNYGNEEYETVDDDSNMIGLDDEDPRGSSWLDNAVGYAQQQQQQHRYVANDPLLSSDLAALSRSRPGAYYDTGYLGQQYLTEGAAGAANAGQQYDGSVQYGTPQYGVPYVQHPYYPPEKRFMVSRKRSQNYDSYGGRSGLMLNSRGYPSFQHRLLY